MRNTSQYRPLIRLVFPWAWSNQAWKEPVKRFSSFSDRYLMVSAETGRSNSVRAGSGIFYPLEYDGTLYKVIKPSYKEKTQLSKRIKNPQFGAPEP